MIRGKLRELMNLAMLDPWPEEGMRARIRASAARSRETLVAIDDDPTGCQTVHDVPILTVWSVEALQREFAAAEPVVFVLTNSRSLPEREAVAVNREVATNIAAAAKATGQRALVLSRSDSTLRG
ncbi:MAG: four-carbon acid sugar kinase family protein, partial [Armatimonadota bacterium]